ncbi:MAG TPA: hypothetical protein VF809_02370 [Candidatus Saccharimonadales bacterium]
MKRKIGTTVLFVLLLLTVFALQKIDAPQAAALDSVGETRHAAY